MRQLVRNTLFLGIGQAVSKSALLILVLVVSKILGAVSLGEAMTGFALATFLRNFLDWGLGKIAVRHISRDPSDAAAFLGAAVRSKRLLWGIGALGYGLAAAWFARLADDPARMGIFLALLGLAQVVNVVGMARGYVFNGLERMDLETLSIALQQGTGLAAAIGMLVAGWGLPSVGLGVLLGSLAGLLMSDYSLRRLGLPAHAGTSERARAILAAGRPIAYGVFCNLVYVHGSTLILRTFLGPEATGFFKVPHQMVLEFQVLPAIAGAAVFPLFSRLGGSGDEGDVAGLLRRARRAGLFLAGVGLAAAVGLSLAAGPLLHLLYSNQPEFWAMGPLLAVLAWVIPMTCLNVLLGEMLYALDGERAALRIALVVSAASLAANLFAIPRFGVWGACGVTLFAEALYFVLDLAVIRGRLRAARAALKG